MLVHFKADNDTVTLIAEFFLEANISSKREGSGYGASDMYLVCLSIPRPMHFHLNLEKHTYSRLLPSLAWISLR